MAKYPDLPDCVKNNRPTVFGQHTTVELYLSCWKCIYNLLKGDECPEVAELQVELAIRISHDADVKAGRMKT